MHSKRHGGIIETQVQAHISLDFRRVVERYVGIQIATRGVPELNHLFLSKLSLKH